MFNESNLEKESGNETVGKNSKSPGKTDLDLSIAERRKRREWRDPLERYHKYQAIDDVKK